jgi:hypothetical protein
MNLLELAYDAALNGLPGMSSVEELAHNYLSKSSDIDDAVNSLIKWQIVKCTTSGIVTGLGGLKTMKYAIPANISSTIYVQTRMIAAIAFMKGFDIRDDRVKSLVFLCLCGNGAKEIAGEAGIKIGEKLAIKMVEKIPGAALVKINQKIGFRLLTKFGEKGVINIGKLTPGVGGIIGGSFDYYTTKIVAKVATSTFRQ